MLGPSLAFFGVETLLKLLQRRLKCFLSKFCCYRCVIRIGVLGLFLPRLIHVRHEQRAIGSARADLAVIHVIDCDLSGLLDGRPDALAGIAPRFRGLIVERADAARGGGDSIDADFGRTEAEVFGRVQFAYVGHYPFPLLSMRPPAAAPTARLAPPVNGASPIEATAATPLMMPVTVEAVAALSSALAASSAAFCMF